MESFRKDILRQIEQIERGRIFTFRDLKFDLKKAANVAVILSEQKKKGVLDRVEKGAYYRPKESVLGFGHASVYHEEMMRYIIDEKLKGGYMSGGYIYNAMGLTEQVYRVITVATPNPIPQFHIQNYYIHCIKSHYKGTIYFGKNTPNKKNVRYLQVLDAIKDIENVAATSAQKVYDRLRRFHFDGFSQDELEKIVSLAKNYPPRVRKTVADMMGDLGQTFLQTEMVKTIPTTARFRLRYETYAERGPKYKDDEY